MPAYNKPTSVDLPRSDSIPKQFQWDQEDSQVVAEQEISSRAGKRKTKNAAVRQPPNNDNADKPTQATQMGQPPSVSPTTQSSILGQLPSAFPPSRKPNAFDTLSDLNASQKVSDEHTPPTDIWARPSSHSRSPLPEPIPGLHPTGSPSYEPGFSRGGGFNARSPPISPPLQKARPVSYGGAIPPLPSHPRISTSPYGYGVTAYESPPALPHLPQQHFYGAHDIDLGLPHSVPQPSPQEPVPLKFTNSIPGSAHEARQAIFLVTGGELNILSYNGEKLEHAGLLRGLHGTIVDATIMTWNSDDDPFSEFRPLVALSVLTPRRQELGSPVPGAPNVPHVHETTLEARVVVYSIAKSCEIVDLLRVPTSFRTFPGIPSVPGLTANLKVHASGNFIVVSCGDSGELFVFGVRRGKESAVFECLGKFWTAIQPQIQRRDSSHGPPSDTDVSPADIGRGPESETPPILSLNGRWLAFCPANSVSRASIGAVLGDFVVYNKNSNVTSGTAPVRPQVNCEVESPDVDTFFSKVAKGFAQEAVKSAKWISEKGMQTWQNYWKKEPAGANLVAAPSSSPPIHSPNFGTAQFPPTHAIDQQGTPKDPDLVTILDLRLLQENQGRKGSETAPMTTFQPPGGCSFLSFIPYGLALLTANRKGDVQYIWDLMQMKHVRSSATSNVAEQVCVRQIARYERLSPSTIVDVAWDGPTGPRFALLTRNRTIHIFDLPKAAFQWPPSAVRKHRPSSVPIDPSQAKTEHEQTSSGGFLASAMSIAGRTQPMLATLRGRAPSVGGGIAGTGIGFASTTTGIKSGGRAVAAGLSKSLGAATETVTSIRHANQSRLYLKIPARVGMFCWLQRDGKPVLAILDTSAVKNYYVRMTKPRENRHLGTVSVFDARKAVATKLPKALELARALPPDNSPGTPEDEEDTTNPLSGFWRHRPAREGGPKSAHPLASAEIETNAPYQPFHSDNKVSISVLPGDPPLAVVKSRDTPIMNPRQATSAAEKTWVFGDEIQSLRTDVPVQPQLEPERSVIYQAPEVALNEATLDEGLAVEPEEVASHAPVLSNSKKKKAKKNRALARTFDEDEVGDSLVDFRADDVPFVPDEDLLSARDEL